MSHRPERKEKNCLNCGAIVQGRFCQVCGQENLEPKETFWGMFMHFFADITHFDGKFFTSLKDLLFRPGFLSAEYMRGRRARYLNPVRMYVFTSAIFFLIFFSIANLNDNFKVTGNEPLTARERSRRIEKVQDKIKEDSTNTDLEKQLAILMDTSVPVHAMDLARFERDFTTVSTFGGTYRDMRQYDSVQHARPSGGRDGWLTRLWNKRAIQLNEKYRYKGYEAMEKLPELILHKLPYLLFVSLPFFAFILKLLYIRRKDYYYADHGIFSIHHYIFTFILILFTIFFGKLEDMTGWSIFEWLTILPIILVGPVYLFIAMKKFYRQGGGKTFVKFLLLNLFGAILLITLLLAFFLFAIFQL
ncbi:MAG TPA: DUF3667 domain-containing protein [Chitinophagaceae bacterium]|nr:DUF3667 domain-containing protein [Chitinophagaceae bacterium]